MKRLTCIAASLLVLCCFATVPSFGQNLPLADKAALQAALQRHIDSLLVDGVYLHLDTKNEEVRGLYPVTAHPTILQMGKHYVLCFDFKDGQGNDVNVDFYMAKRERSYIVFHSTVNDREFLKRLTSAGKVTRFDE